MHSQMQTQGQVPEHSQSAESSYAPLYPIEKIRAEFPGLRDDYAFFDNAGGSQVLKRVADRVHEYLLSTSVQLGASYEVSRVATERVLAARRSIASLINAAHDEEVVMGGSSTGLVYLLVQALRPSLQAGDEIIITNIDHEANVGAWRRLLGLGVVVKVWCVDPVTFTLPLEQLDKLLSPRTKWLAMSQTSNVLGMVNPVAEATARVHAVGGRVCVDSVAYAPHRLVDVQACGADVVFFSFYKVFGPHYAVMWGKRDFLLALPNLNHGFIPVDDLPYKLQPGNVNFELSYGCVGIVEYLESMSNAMGGAGTQRELMQFAFDEFARYEDYLGEILLQYLRSEPRVRIIGADTMSNGLRVPTICFVVEGMQSEAIVLQMDQHQIGIRFGDFYAKKLIADLQLLPYGGVVRVSMAHYNTVKEVERLVAVLRTIISPSAA